LISPSSTAVFITARRNRYALAVATGPVPESRRHRCAAPLAHPSPGSALGAPARHGRAALLSSRRSIPSWALIVRQDSYVPVSHTSFGREGSAVHPQMPRPQPPMPGPAQVGVTCHRPHFWPHRMPPVLAIRACGTLFLPADHGYLYPPGRTTGSPVPEESRARRGRRALGTHGHSQTPRPAGQAMRQARTVQIPKPTVRPSLPPAGPQAQGWTGKCKSGHRHCWAEAGIHPLAIGQDRPSRLGVKPAAQRVADGERMNPPKRCGAYAPIPGDDEHQGDECPRRTLRVPARGRNQRH
jgi:hypothetical protein